MLKLVSGKYRSRSIDVPPSVTVPTKNMVRTAIGNALMEDLRGADVLDLFAGSGALGFESLSRGAKHCTFVDASKEAIDVLRKNQATLKETNCDIIFADYKDALKRLKTPFDIVYLDPPYKMKEVYLEVPKMLLELNLLTPNAAVVLEYEGEIEAPVDLYSFSKVYNYGRTHILLLRR
ncbi:MAG: 16S rRNA (guanine(966)-N(2))-methyltransferase RsmD [Bacilli bacterium]|nr:16S rRNA (guanine(966)-N(2))-methyltransferase RsmD [Bacilli bacterium]